MVEPGVHAEAVEFDFVQPFGAAPGPVARAASVAAGSTPAGRRAPLLFAPSRARTPRLSVPSWRAAR